MSIIQGNAKQASTRGFYDFPLEQSLRFNDDDSAYLSWTPASSGDRKTWTWSGWVKRAGTGTRQYLFSTGSSGTNYAHFMIDSDDKLYFVTESPLYRIGSTAKFRDHGAWYHFMFVMDTTNATANDRMRYYVNGERVDVGVFNTQPTQNLDMKFNQAASHSIGKQNYSTDYADCYMAEVNFIDGQALDPTSFGELKNGVWIPKDPSGLTYGTNGFRLSFADDAEVEAFNTVLYRGNGATQSITGMGFQPDLVWIKNRSSAQSHSLSDAVRGFSNILQSNETSAESSGGGVSVISDGFTLENGNALRNTSGNSYVAWGWKAGDSNVSNTDGSITSTVRANTTYGFSIVSTENHTGSQTVGHGLSSAPDWIVAKARNGALLWPVYHSALGNTKRLRLNDTTAAETNAVWGNTDPTTSVFTFNQSSSTYNYIFYCWAEKAGYSKFGSYTGDGTSDGSKSITCGFKPAWVMIKRSDDVNNWIIHDNTRDVTNPTANELYANLANSESSGRLINLDDNGFSLPDSGPGINGSGGTYIYAAFADTREAAFWLDQSGNDNDWQPVNLDHNDTVADSPTDNFATLNAIDLGAQTELSDGNLVFRGTTTAWNTQFATFAPTSGKWYCELEVIAKAVSSRVALGIATQSVSSGEFAGNSAEAYVYYDKGEFYHDGVVGSAGFLTPMSIGDVVALALDLDNHTVSWYLNNTLQRTETNIDSSLNWFIITNSYSGGKGKINFGQQDFTYTPPTDYLALSTANLPDPEIDPAQGSSPEDYFNTVLYTGTSDDSAKVITGVGFQPDFIWSKGRSGTYAVRNHFLRDAVRGANKNLHSNTTDAEATDSGNSFDVDGVTLSSDYGQNGLNTNHVLWSWKANGSGVSNTDGSITSTVSANTESGFSIVSYTGTGVQGTIGHGLSQAPDLIIHKRRNSTNSWLVSSNEGDLTVGTNYIYLDETSAKVANGNNTQSFDSTTWQVGTGGNSNTSGAPYIAYVFHSVDGYSKIGGYTGNGSTDGPFVYTGFRPAFVIVKRTNSTADWQIGDATRDTHNLAEKSLQPNQNYAEGTVFDSDFLSNGFKLRNSGNGMNASGGTYIYMAFAENPFKYSNAR